MKNINLPLAFRWAAYILIYAPVIILLFSLNEAREFVGSNNLLFWCTFTPMLVGLLLRRFYRKHPRSEDTVRSIRKAKHLLFPPVVKWVGYGITLAGTILLITLHDHRLWSAMIGGLWIAMWSRDSLEDEMMREVRLSVAWFALSFVAVYAVFLNIWSDMTLATEHVVFLVMLYYHAVLWMFKWKISREKHN